MAKCNVVSCPDAIIFIFQELLENFFGSLVS
jgi:hypothetical protein